MHLAGAILSDLHVNYQLVQGQFTLEQFRVNGGNQDTNPRFPGYKHVSQVP